MFLQFYDDSDGPQSPQTEIEMNDEDKYKFMNVIDSSGEQS